MICFRSRKLICETNMPSDTSVLDYTTKEAQNNAFNKKMIKWMEKRKDSKLEYLPYSIGYLTDELKEMAENELNETEEKKEKCLKKFRQLIAGNAIFTFFDTSRRKYWFRAIRFLMDLHILGCPEHDLTIFGK